MEILNKYNIKFVTDYDLQMINPHDTKYIDLMYFLIALQHPENVYDYIVPKINESLRGKIILDDICSGTVSVQLNGNNSYLEWENRITELPTKDFKYILVEYAEFRWK